MKYSNYLVALAFFIATPTLTVKELSIEKAYGQKPKETYEFLIKRIAQLSIAEKTAFNNEVRSKGKCPQHETALFLASKLGNPKVTFVENENGQTECIAADC